MWWQLNHYYYLLVLSSTLPGRHPGLCKSLQRHLCILGLRLPAGPHLPDTSLLLGRHQSELPGEQLCLEGAAPAMLEGQTHTFFIFTFCFSILFVFRFSNRLSWAKRDVSVSGQECVCVCVCVWRSLHCMLDWVYCYVRREVYRVLMSPVACDMFQRMSTHWTNPACVAESACLSTRTQILPRTCQKMA